MGEPHPFTVASSPLRPDGELEFVIAHLGDWSDRLPEADLVGKKVKVEGPYGRFQPLPKHSDTPTLWVAGGVGITPFLAAIEELRHRPSAAGIQPPTLVYCTREAATDPIVADLQLAEQHRHITLEVFDRSTGRFGVAALDRMYPSGMVGHHVAVCGPEGLVHDVTDVARRRGASTVESEDFDIRQGFGPERSRQWRSIAGRITGRLRPGSTTGRSADANQAPDNLTRYPLPRAQTSSHQG